MNKKILSVAVASIFLLSACVGLAQIKQVSATTYYKIEIKVSSMKLYDDGDGNINGIDKGEIYMLDPGSDWPSGDSKKYKGGFTNIGYPYLYIYQELQYDISGQGVSYSTLDTPAAHDYTYYLMDKDLGADDQLWRGKVRITGTTGSWVSGWSGADDSTVSLGSGVTITTWHTLYGTYEFSTSGPGTIGTWTQTFTNALFFQVRVTTTNMN